MARALFSVGLVCLAFTAAGAISAEAEADDAVTGRQLLANGQWVFYPQNQAQLGGNIAKNTGTANQQSSQQALEQYGDDNEGSNSNSQSIDTGRKLLDSTLTQTINGHVQAIVSDGQGQWVWNSGQAQWVFHPAGHVHVNAADNNGSSDSAVNQESTTSPAVNQQSSDTGGGLSNTQSSDTAGTSQVNQQSNRNGDVVSYNSQTSPNGDSVSQQRSEQSPGRKLLGWYQNQNQFGGNVAKNVGTANQQNSQQVLEQYGDGNSGSNSNSQSIQTGPEPPAKDPPAKSP